MGLPPPLVILRPQRPEVFESSTLSSSGGEPTFPTCHCAKARRRPICSTIFMQLLTMAMREVATHTFAVQD